VEAEPDRGRRGAQEQKLDQEARSQPGASRRRGKQSNRVQPSRRGAAGPSRRLEAPEAGSRRSNSTGACAAWGPDQRGQTRVFTIDGGYRLVRTQLWTW